MRGGDPFYRRKNFQSIGRVKDTHELTNIIDPRDTQRLRATSKENIINYSKSLIPDQDFKYFEPQAMVKLNQKSK
jgi:hypothetical protein